MDNNTFSNETILAWLNFFSNGTLIDLEHVKILDITRKNKNVVPTVEAHKTTLVFTKAGDDDIFYRLWNAGLGDCEVWFNEGNVTAVEYSSADRNTLEDNIEHFCLHNINIVDHVDEKTMKDCPVPDVVFMVASASMDQELDYFIRVNPKVRIVIYTLDFTVAAGIKNTLEPFGIINPEIIQVSVSTLESNNMFKQQPAPWIISAKIERFLHIV